MVGQSGTDKPDPVLVTSPPAMTRTNVAAATARANRWSQTNLMRPAYVVLNENETVLVSFGPIVTDCVWAPSFSCHASIV